ncbi:hypothetical protein ACWGH8_22140 [Nonomuraea muscovyensis]
MVPLKPLSAAAQSTRMIPFAPSEPDALTSAEPGTRDQALPS